jgi:hypothetical protein
MKKPKRVELGWKECTYYVATYQCPECKIIYVGGGPSRNATRFLCNCGQELIVSNKGE